MKIPGISEAEQEQAETDITERIWSKQYECDRIACIEIEMYNAANHNFQGIYLFGENKDIEKCFRGQCGDIHGFLCEWSDDLRDEPLPSPPRYKLVPLEPDKCNPEIVHFFVNRADMKEAVRKANYDLLFSPTLKTREYWDNFFARVKGKLVLDTTD